MQSQLRRALALAVIPAHDGNCEDLTESAPATTAANRARSSLDDPDREWQEADCLIDEQGKQGCTYRLRRVLQNLQKILCQVRWSQTGSRIQNGGAWSRLLPRQRRLRAERQGHGAWWWWAYTAT